MVGGRCHGVVDRDTPRVENDARGVRDAPGVLILRVCVRLASSRLSQRGLCDLCAARRRAAKRAIPKSYAGREVVRGRRAGTAIVSRALGWVGGVGVGNEAPWCRPG